MSTFSGIRTIKLWTCCQCRENGISMSLGECPKCDGHSRCYDCDVKSHAASDAEIEEENLKIARSAGRDLSSVRSRRQPNFEPESSRGGDNVTISFDEDENPFARHSGLSSDEDEGPFTRTSSRSPSPYPPSVRSREQPNLEPESSMAAGNVTISSDRVARTLPSGQAPSLPRMSSSRAPFATANRASLIIRVAAISENDPVYVLREHHDSDLIALWNQTLPSISQHCKIVSRDLVSIHLFRIGKSEESSTPTIIVNTKAPLLDQEKEDILNAISLHRGPSPFPGTYITSDSIQLVFRQSRLRRSVDTSGADEPPICEPRNRHFHTLPSTGDSIGISGSIQDTATLGCYLTIGDVPFILTVDHLMPWRSPILDITHISEQDQYALTMKALNHEISRLTAATAHSCPGCDPELTRKESDQPSLRAFYLLEILQSSEVLLWSCSFLQLLKQWYSNPERARYRSHVVARSHASSGRRRRTYGNVSREMDWAILKVEDAAPLHLLPELLSQHDQARSDFGDDLTGALDIRPGALVASIGRTSGYQTGKISTTLSSIFHEEYVTQEWCVIKRPETSVEEWVEGGIGVEGDSGALIVDETTKEIYGMLWGRTGDGAATATIFTPLRDIFEDIEWRCSCPLPGVGILKGQQFPGPFMGTGSLPPVRESIETATLRFLNDFYETESPPLVRGSNPTVPISVQPFETNEEKTFEYTEAFEFVRVADPQGDFMIRRPVRRERESMNTTYEDDRYARQPVYQTRSPVTRLSPAFYDEYDPRHPEPAPAIPEQFVVPIPTAAISIQHVEKEEEHNQPFEQALSSVSLTRQSSADLVRRLPFRRYHKYDRSISDQDIGLGLATPQQEREDKVESKSWPGTHTYLRYALGDQG